MVGILNRRVSAVRIIFSTSHIRLHAGLKKDVGIGLQDVWLLLPICMEADSASPGACGYMIRIGLSSEDRALKSILASALGKDFHRSEEHTSELQSLRHLVCRLLLE